MLRRTLLNALLTGLLLLPTGCSPEEEQALPRVLNVGVLPDDEASALERRYAPLLAHLSAELDIELQLTVPETYTELLELFGGGEVDIAYFGGASFIHALNRHGATPVVMRDIDVNFTTYFLAVADSSASAIQDFEGRSLAFGSELSTSGHLMPRYFLQEMGITPEGFFAAVSYTGAHDRTAVWVRDGVVDLGAANSEIVETMFRDGRLTPDSVKVVWETPPYADYVWAMQPELGESFRNRLRDAFLMLSPAEEPFAEILERMGAQGFLPASADDFSRLEEIMQSFPQFRTE